MLAVVPARHAAAAGEVAGAKALTSLPLILLARGENPAMHDEMLSLCRASGIEPNLGPPLKAIQEAEALIAAGCGWLLIAEGIAPGDAGGVAVRPVPEPQPHTHVSLVRRAVGVSAPATASSSPRLTYAADTRRATARARPSRGPCPRPSGRTPAFPLRAAGSPRRADGRRWQGRSSRDARARPWCPSRCR